MSLIYPAPSSASPRQAVSDCPFHPCWLQVCSHCGRAAADIAVEAGAASMGKLLKISGCSGAMYCGRECQVEHWKAGHKAECKALAAELRGQAPTPPIGS